METKDKTVETAAGEQPRKKRPAGSRPAGAPGKEQRRKKAPEGHAAPEAGTARNPKSKTARTPQEEQPRKKRPADAPRRKRPAERAADAPKRKTASRKKKPAELQYKPYKKANDRRRTVRNRELALKITKFFSYENPILRLFSKPESEVFGGGGRVDRKQAEEERRRRRAAELNAPAIVYTQPRPFNRNRLIVQLITVLAVVLALVMGMSVFFKVKVITVSGNNVYSAWTVRESSGINEGDNLLTFGRTRASGKIIANLPYVKSARIGIKLPDTVNIEIEEAAVVYAIQDEDGVWWLMNAEGRVVEQTSASNARNYTKVLGITLAQPQAGAQAIATEPLPTETNELGEYLPVTTTGASQLNAALHILQALEANDIVGSVSSVDVTWLSDIILWYGSQYQVNLGNTDRLDYKIACMNDAILQMSGYQTGVLDVSFSTMTDKVVFTPFG